MSAKNPSKEDQDIKKANEIMASVGSMAPEVFFAYRNELFIHHPYIKHLVMDDFGKRVSPPQLAKLSQLVVVIWIWFREWDSAQNLEVTEDLYVDLFKQFGKTVDKYGEEVYNKDDSKKTAQHADYRIVDEIVLYGIIVTEFDRAPSLNLLGEEKLEFMIGFINFIRCFEALEKG